MSQSHSIPSFPLQNLPSTTHDFIFRSLSICDLFSYRLANRRACSDVEEYLSRTFRIENFLKPYIPLDKIPGFRLVQSETGCLISGSSALSFFTREIYNGSGLDLFVEWKFCERLVLFLVEDVGYEYRPRRGDGKEQNIELKKAIKDMMGKVVSSALDGNDNDDDGDDDDDGDGDGEDVSEDGEDGEEIGENSDEDDGSTDEEEQEERQNPIEDNSIVDIFSLKKGDKRIQVIVSFSSPLDIVLGAHSTVVMNIITHVFAISFYPQATFIDGISLQFWGGYHDAAREKYTRRGWKPIHNLDALSVVDPNSAFHHILRTPKDKHSWSIVLPPYIEGMMLDSTTAVESWQLTFVGDADAQLMYGTTQSNRLERGYCIADDLSESVDRIIEDLEAKEEG
ncbi:hypothetical protein AAF712_010923 [Marasmius tenuissimus]|uniref:F-box domain-containing protein n=1 Tax=Marasmius tenuissimus TaxID=585030 RepID=A0ABR2ZKI5_9AGAR